MQFYVLRDRESGDADTTALAERGFKSGDAPVVPRCGQFIGMLAWLPPYRVILELYGSHFADVVFLPAGNDFLVSERFRDLYLASKLKGLSGFEPVTVVRVKSRQRKRPQPPQYYKVGVHYGRAALDLAASGCEWETPPTCDECRLSSIKRWKQIAIEVGTWDGHDAFRPRGLAGTILVTERFKDFCESNALSNAQFTPAEQAGHDFYPWEKQPGRSRND